MTNTTQAARNVALLAIPMHGQHKLSGEGYRTRDGHFIEWFGELLESHGPVGVVSRPEPRLLQLRKQPHTQRIAPNTVDYSATSLKIPDLRDRRRWWIQSLGAYNGVLKTAVAPVVAWNPFIGLSASASALKEGAQPFVFDLLDDWTVHYAFQTIWPEVREAYAATFAMATAVTANSEATLELAHRYGRTDAVLVTNGCDPERFSTESRAAGPLTVGYVGKIGKRVDLELVERAADALPDVQFVFAGPILDAEYRAPLESRANIQLLGDVHYEDVPALLETFDVGWVPHRVGEGEVGGDVIKTYEYRAAWLRTITTPVLGASSRGLDHVEVADRAQIPALLAEIASKGTRSPRLPGVIPQEATWRQKAVSLLGLVGIDVA